MPQTLKLQDLGPTPAACLAARCETQSSEPWLFFRRGWKWRWASYGQVADQIVRGLQVMRPAATSAPEGAVWVTHGTQNPDVLAVACMLLEVGGTLRLRRPAADGSWPPLTEGPGQGERWVYAAEASADAEPGDADPVDPPPDSGLITVPTIAGQLDRRSLESLDPASLGVDGTSRVEDGDGPRTLSDLRDRAVQLVEILAREHRPQEAGSWFGRWRARRRLPRRPIVCVSPAMSPVDQLVVAWATLALDGAWVLEPQLDAFLPTVDWVRPTVAVTDPDHEDELHRRLVAMPRGHRRVRSVIGWPPGASGTVDPQLWQELGIGRGPFP